MPRAFITTLTFLLAVLLTDVAASAQDTPRHGRALLREFCGNCHAIGRSDRSRMPYAVPFRTLGRTFDLDRFPQLLERGISSTHPDMPEFKFSKENARAAAVYLRSIQE